MSSRLSPATLVAVFTAPLIGLAALALTGAFRHPPATPAARPALPSVGIWQVVCPPNGWGWGPYSSPDACRGRLESTMRTCNRPLVDGHPNPDFLQIAGLCRDAYNATHCTCEFQLVVAQTPPTRLQTADEFLFGPRRPPTPTEAMFGHP